MQQIAIYGKGGIGKSTVSSNLSGTWARMGIRVMQLGCDPKQDSTRNLVGGRMLPTVLDTLRDTIEAGRTEADVRLEDVVHWGYLDVACVEAGGPEPGIGCAGRGVLTAVTLLNRLDAFSVYKPDVVLYDVLGDVVCGGFAQPIREGFAEAVYLVCSSQFMSLYAANNIGRAIARHAQRGRSRLAGVIHNSCESDIQTALVAEFASRMGTRVIGRIPRSITIQKAETQSKTVVEAYPDSAAAEAFSRLARDILDNRSLAVPTPMANADLEVLCHSYLRELEE